MRAEVNQTIGDCNKESLREAFCKLRFERELPRHRAMLGWKRAIWPATRCHVIADLRLANVRVALTVPEPRAVALQNAPARAEPQVESNLRPSD